MEPLLLQTDTALSQVVFVRFFKEMEEKLRSLLPANRRVIAIIDEKVDELYGDLFPYDKITVVAEERAKTMATVEHLVRRLMEMGAERDVFLLGVGGGITTDICGFVASIYKRGVRFGFVPTTLLAMTDASIGGKNGVNADGYKNMLGTIVQPEFVLVCPEFLGSFTKYDICRFVPEILKCCLIVGKGFDETVAFFEKADSPAVRKSEKTVQELLSRIRDAVAVKCSVVAKDEKESGERRILNLGHTFAHALERCTEGKLSHGEAVGIGLVLAAKNGGAEMLSEKIAGGLKRLGLPSQIPDNLDVAHLSESVLQDKKISGHLLNLVVIDDAGKVSLCRKSVSDLIWM